MAIARPRITEEEFMRLPDDGRKHELVDGEVTDVPANVEHDVIGAHLIGIMYPFARGFGFLVSSQAGFRMLSKNIRCPDVSFTLKENFPGGKPPATLGDRAPDLCVEIISKYEDRQDMKRKVREYFDSGAQTVWHVYPEEQEVVVFSSPADSRTLTAGDEIDCPDLLRDFRCKVADFFDFG